MWKARLSCVIAYRHRMKLCLWCVPLCSAPPLPKKTQKTNNDQTNKKTPTKTTNNKQKTNKNQKNTWHLLVFKFCGSAFVISYLKTWWVWWGRRCWSLPDRALKVNRHNCRHWCSDVSKPPEAKSALRKGCSMAELVCCGAWESQLLL